MTEYPQITSYVRRAAGQVKQRNLGDSSAFPSKDFGIMIIKENTPADWHIHYLAFMEELEDSLYATDRC